MAKKSKGLPVTQNVTTGKAAAKEMKGMEKDAAPSMKQAKESMERERKWEIKDAMQTLQRAEELKSDKQLMRDVKKAAKEQVKHLSKI